MTGVDEDVVPDYLGRLRLDGRGIVVVGAGNGIGRQAAHAVAQAGASVFCIDKDAGRAEAISREIARGTAGVADVTVRGEVDAIFVDALDVLGRVDGVINIVGGAVQKPFLDIDDATWAANMGLNLYSALVVMQAGARVMGPSGGGAMVMTSSACGVTSSWLNGSYGAAKRGLMSLVQTAAIELAPLGIRVNSVVPGITLTPRAKAMVGEAGERWASENIPVGRAAQTYEQAAVMLFLVSDLSSYVNGQNLIVDGGMQATFPYATMNDKPLALSQELGGLDP